jgi:hypothetical protein
MSPGKGRHDYPPKAVQRSLLEFVFGEMIEAAEGVSVASNRSCIRLVGALDVGGEAADAGHDAGILAHPAGIFGHGAVAGVAKAVFNASTAPVDLG